MTKALLIEYFDNDRWHCDLFFALFKVQSSWSVSDFYNAFMAACCAVNSPAGSAAQIESGLQGWIRQGYCTFDHDTKIVTAGVTTSGRPIAEVAVGDALVPHVKAAIEARRMEALRQERFKGICDRTDRSEITTEQSLAEMKQLNVDFPRRKRRKA